MNKNILACGVGTLVEWAEFTFYAYLVTQFSFLFFPHLNENLRLLAGFGTFAVSYLARPLGGFFFGHWGDKYGRQKALSGSIFLMAFVTFLMGLLPTYNQMGFIAPLLLMTLRFLQGFAVGGEFMGAAIFLYEQSNEHTHRFSSWASTTSAAGMTLGGLMALIVNLPHMPHWLWRMPFLLCAATGWLGFYIRQTLLETPIYQNLKKSQTIEKIPILKIISQHKMALVKTAILAAFVGIYIYICNIWWIAFAIQHHALTALQAQMLALFAQGLVVLLTPLFAYLTNREQSEKLMRLGFFLAIFVAPLLFYFTKIRLFSGLISAEIFYALCNAMITASMFKYLAELFPPNIRYSGQAVGWNFSIALFGGTAPLIAQYFSNAGYFYLPSFYVAMSALLAFIVPFFQARLNEKIDITV